MRERELIELIVNNVEKVIVGKRAVIYDIMKGILAGGHILIEDIPGVGKTTLVKAIAKSTELSCNRIQFTPDLMPSDITGVSIYNQKELAFEFIKGPVFSNMVLADEINRTSPKTQAALLEVMEESQVSEGNKTYKLDKPFIVLATENPIEHGGTFKLPEAQLDRFMINIDVGYPSKEAEIDILSLYRDSNPLDTLDSVIKLEDIIYLQDKLREISINKSINEYIVDIANATRNSKYISLGVSTRGVLAMQRIAQATALINGRNYVIPEDVKSNVKLVFKHRIILSSLAKSSGIDKDQVLIGVLNGVNVPKVV